MTSWGASPLRYPGGKAKLAPFFVDAIHGRRIETICEPFAGGAGASIRLLLDEFIDEIVLNDMHSGIAAFWRAVFRYPNEFARLIERIPLSVDEWHRQHEAGLTAKPGDDLALGFATFYLNRTNRSGILRGRPIGGFAQDGEWKIDARFNRAELARRVRRLGLYANRVTILEQDGVNVARRYLGSRTLVYADPPYLVRGGRLYLNAMTWNDHERLASVLRRSASPWIVTYDCDPRIPELYPDNRRAEFGLTHSAGEAHAGREYVVFSSSLGRPDLRRLGSRPLWCSDETASVALAPRN